MNREILESLGFIDRDKNIRIPGTNLWISDIVEYNTFPYYCKDLLPTAEEAELIAKSISYIINVRAALGIHHIPFKDEYWVQDSDFKSFMIVNDEIYFSRCYPIMYCANIVYVKRTP